MHFIRFGTINPIKQDSFRDDKFHSAPAKKGIYAFPYNKIDYFLIGSTWNVDNASCKSKWIKDFNGNKIKYYDLIDDCYDTSIKPEYKKLAKVKRLKKNRIVMDRDGYAILLKKPKRINHKGLLWHHLIDYVDGKDVIDIHNGWALTSYNAYVDAFNKCDARERCKSRLIFKNDYFDAPIYKFPNTYSVDHYEVFIEKIKE
mgnify:CR=1 FL=1